MVYVNPAGFPTPGLENQGYVLFINLMIMIVISGVFVTARIATRASQRQLGSDDWTSLASMCSLLVQTTLWALSVRDGYGADYLSLSEPQRFGFTKWWFLGSIFWLCTLVLYKTSILLLLDRIFVQRSFKYACWSILVINACWGFGNILGWIFQCLPVSSMWGVHPADVVPDCFDQNGLWISIVAWDVSTDLAILILPQPMVWKLSLKRREKVMLTGMFVLGAIVVLLSLMSCGALMAKLQALATDKNQYTYALANIFQVLETGVGVSCSCLPILRQPLRKLFPCLRRSTQQDVSYYYDIHSTDQHGGLDVAEEKRNAVLATADSISIPELAMSRSTSRRTDELEMIEHGIHNRTTDLRSNSQEPLQP